MYNNINNIEIDVTEKCNLKCKYCYLENRDNEKYFTKDVFDCFFDKFNESSRNNTKLYVSYWGGEPLLNFQLIKYSVEKFNKIKNNNFEQIFFHIITNGTLITDKIALYSKQNNISFQITLDGTKEQHDKYRVDHEGNGSYEKILSNINMLNKHKVRYHIRSTLVSESIAPSTFVKELVSNGVKSVAFGIVTPTEKFKDNALSVNKVKFFADDIFESFLSSMKNDIPIIFMDIERIMVQISSTFPRTTCGVGKHKLSITEDGTFFPCHRFVNTPELNSGNLFDGLGYMNLKNAFIEEANTIKYNSTCQQCQINFLCGGSCSYDSTIKFFDWAKSGQSCYS